MAANCLSEAIDYISVALSDKESPSFFKEWCDVLRKVGFSFEQAELILSILFNLKDNNSTYRICKNGFNLHWVEYHETYGKWSKVHFDDSVNAFTSFTDAKNALDKYIDKTDKINDVQVIYEV